MNDCFVYIDRKPCGEPFYVGIGTAKRVRLKDRNAHHKNICNKYPDWTREIFYTGDTESCKRIEKYLIAEFGRRDLGLGTLVNMTDGGDGTNGWQCTPEELDRRSAQSKKLWQSEEHRERMRKLSTGRSITDEARAKIGDAHRGKVISIEVREKIRSKLIGRKPTEEAVRKSAESRKGMVFTEERKQNISKALTGKKQTPEQIQKFREATTGMVWWNDGNQRTRSFDCPGEGWVRGKRLKDAA